MNNQSIHLVKYDNIQIQTHRSNICMNHTVFEIKVIFCAANYVVDFMTEPLLITI